MQMIASALELEIREDMNPEIKITSRAAVDTRLPFSGHLHSHSGFNTARNLNSDLASIYLDLPLSTFVGFPQTDRDVFLTVIAITRSTAGCT